MIVQIKSDDMVEFPENESMGYDCSYTTDLEESIKKSGFSDPIEVCRINKKLQDALKKEFGTEYSLKSYMIVSGHRRKKAGVITGMEKFPCVLREFDDYIKLRRAVLEANMHRGKGGSPIQTAKEINAWKVQCKLEKKKGDLRKYLAEMMGIAQGTIQRYQSLLKMIPEIQLLVDKGYLGLSNVTKLGNMKENEQKEVLEMFKEYTDTIETEELQGNEKYTLITRDTCEKIIGAYKNGYKTWADFNIVAPTEDKVEEVTTVAPTEDKVEEVTTVAPTEDKVEEVTTVAPTEDKVEEVKAETHSKDKILEWFIRKYFKDMVIRTKTIRAIRGARRDKAMQEFLAPCGYRGSSREEYSHTFHGYAGGVEISIKKLGKVKCTYKEFTDKFVELYNDEYYNNYTVEDEKADKVKKDIEQAVLKLTDLLELSEKRVYDKDEINQHFAKVKVLKDMLIDELDELSKDKNCTRKIGTVV